MTAIRISIVSIALLMLVAAPIVAQNQPAPQTPKKSAAGLSTKMEDVASWTKQQWYAAKAKWVKEKGQIRRLPGASLSRIKIYGRKSCVFLYGCMT